MSWYFEIWVLTSIYWYTQWLRYSRRSYQDTETFIRAKIG